MRKLKQVMVVAAFCLALLFIWGVLTFNTLPSNPPIGSPPANLNVKIVDFNLTGYNNPVGVVWNSVFVLTYLNNGTTDVDNVTVTFDVNSTYSMDREIEVFNSTHPHYYIESFAMGASYPLGLVKAGEAKEFHGDISNNLDDSAKIRGFAFMATLKSNDTILDQAIVNIP